MKIKMDKEWFGHFRGSPRAVAVSKKHKVLVLTSDYLFLLDRLNGDIAKYDPQPQYQTLTVTPLGDFIIGDYYHIEVIESTLIDKKLLKNPFQIDDIKFKEWSNNKLSITCT